MTTDIAAKYDLTERLMPFLDRSLIFPLLENLSDKKIYPDREILKLKYDLLKDTKIIDYKRELYEELKGDADVPSDIDFDQEQKKVDAELAELEKNSAKVLAALENPDVKNALKQDKSANIELLAKDHGISKEMIDQLYSYGQVLYQTGKYHACSDALYHFRFLCVDSTMVASATWGKLAADILSMQWDAALEELTHLRDIVDNRQFTNSDPLVQLHYRSWIIHWSLFPFFNSASGKENLCDLFFTSSYLSTIQAACPWILRYMVVAVVASYPGANNSKNAAKDKDSASSPSSMSMSTFSRKLKDLIRTVSQELYEYQDPLTEFIKALYIDYNFEEAQNKLVELEQILRTDFFLINSADAFLNSARHLVSELYCRIHHIVDVNQLSARLNLTPEQGEKWIANLIQDTKMDAKIDESKGVVIMNHPVTSVYQQVIEKTKGLSFRSNQTLNQAVNKHENVVVS